MPKHETWCHVWHQSMWTSQRSVLCYQFLCCLQLVICPCCYHPCSLQMFLQLCARPLFGATGLRVHLPPGVDQPMVQWELPLQQPQHLLQGGGPLWWVSAQDHRPELRTLQLRFLWQSARPWRWVWICLFLSVLNLCFSCLSLPVPVRFVSLF